MAYQLIERPHKFSFSKNPVRYLVNITNPSTPGCALDVELWTLPIGTVYDAVNNPGTLVTTQTLFPNPDGKVYFYCEDFLNSFLDWELPQLDNNDIKTCTKQICQYFIRYRQTTKFNPTPPWTTDVENIRTAIKGGIAKEKFDRNNFFINYLPAQKPFFSWQPDKHFIGTEERRYLTYFHDDDKPFVTINEEVVYKENAEWAASSSGASVDVDSANNPFEGAKDVEATNMANDDWALFVGPVLSMADYTVLEFKIRSKGDWGADKLNFKLKNEVDEVGSVDVGDGDYGFDSTNVDDYQTIQIPIEDFGVPLAFDRLLITAVAAGTIGFYIDNIIFKNNGYQFPELFLKARVIYTNGDMDQVSIAFPSLDDSLLFHCPAGLDQLGLYNLQPAKKIWYYDVSVVDGDGNVFATAYRLYADYRKYYHAFSFIYHNSLGGIDTLRIRGEYDIEISRDFTEIQQATGGDFSSPLLPTEIAAINISKFDIYKGDAGWFNTQKMQDSIQDMLLSDNVYRIVFNRWLRVYNMQKTQAMGASDDTKWSFPLQWRYTFDNTQYTPFDKDFGVGVNDSVPGGLYGTCTAPVNLQRELIDPDDPDGQRWEFTWDEVIGAAGYRLEYFSPVTLQWNEVLCDTNSKQLVFEDAGDYQWRVRTECGENDFSGYANGPGFTVDFGAATCDAPANLDVILMSIDGANADVKFVWPAVVGVVGYVIEWREFGAGAWNSAQTADLFYTVTVLKDTQYQCRVRSVCDGTPTYSGYVYGPNFIPSNMAGTCANPSDLDVRVIHFPIIGFSIRFTWTDNGGADNFELNYKEDGSPDWIVVNGVSSGYILMLPQSDHDKTWNWRVRSNCTGGGFSFFVAGPDFNT